MSVPRIADHGGGLARAMARFGAGADWLDLSTGINPWPYPVPAIAPEAWQRLPDQDALDALKAAARGFYGLGPAAPVGGRAGLAGTDPAAAPAGAAGPGSRCSARGYAEHARCWAPGRSRRD
ncbi:MAG: hypothetical protein WDN69_02505 [Aliidongia sp.]